MARNIKRDRKAISPVISTIIIVAIAIAIAIAVAYQMVGITGGFTQFEKVDVTTIYADAWTNTTSGYNVTVTMKNSGQTAVTLERININGKPATGTAVAFSPAIAIETVAGKTGAWDTSLSPEENRTIRLLCATGTGNNAAFTGGVSIEVALLTTRGNTYPKSVNFP